MSAHAAHTPNGRGSRSAGLDRSVPAVLARVKCIHDLRFILIFTKPFILIFTTSSSPNLSTSNLLAMSVIRPDARRPSEAIALDNLAGRSSRGAGVDLEAQTASQSEPVLKDPKSWEQRQRKIVWALCVLSD